MLEMGTFLKIIAPDPNGVGHPRHGKGNKAKNGNERFGV